MTAIVEVGEPEFEVRCPRCGLLLATYTTSAGGATMTARCRRCHVTYTVQLQSDGPTATLAPNSGRAPVSART